LQEEAEERERHGRPVDFGSGSGFDENVGDGSDGPRRDVAAEEAAAER
jgi:hypothetical protein